MIELLVVMATIALIASLLLPALNSAGRKARAIACVGNLRQQGVALQLYVQEQSLYPLASSGRSLGAWQRATRLAAGEQTLYCPEKGRPTDAYLRIFTNAHSLIQPHYGYNSIGAALGHLPAQNPGLGGDMVAQGAGLAYIPTPENRVRAPARMIAIGDSPGMVPPSTLATNVSPADALHVAFPFDVPAWGRIGVGSWHDRGANMVFCDAHVEYAKQSMWTAAAPERRCLWNNDNLPHL